MSPCSGTRETQVVQADGGEVGVAGGFDEFAGTGVAVDDDGDAGDLAPTFFSASMAASGEPPVVEVSSSTMTRLPARSGPST